MEESPSDDACMEKVLVNYAKRSFLFSSMMKLAKRFPSYASWKGIHDTGIIFLYYYYPTRMEMDIYLFFLFLLNETRELLFPTIL